MSLLLVLGQFNLQQFIDNQNVLHKFIVGQYNSQLANLLQQVALDHLYYDPPIAMESEYLQYDLDHPPDTASSALLDAGFSLSFNIKEYLTLRTKRLYEDVFNQSLSLFYAEGQLLDNPSYYTSIITMQPFSKDIVLMNISSKIRQSVMIKIMEQLATPFDRIWLYSAQSDGYFMTNLQDYVNGITYGDPQANLDLMSVVSTYDFIQKESLGRYEKYKNDIFANFLILVDDFEEKRTFGKINQNINIFYWYTRLLQEEKQLLTSPFSYFCQLPSCDDFAQIRNSCLSQAIRIIAEQNIDLNLHIAVYNDELVIARAHYCNNEYVGINYSVSNISAIHSQSVLDDVRQNIVCVYSHGAQYIALSRFSQNTVSLLGTGEQYYQPFPYQTVKIATQERKFVLLGDEYFMPLYGVGGVGLVQRRIEYYSMQAFYGSYYIKSVIPTPAFTHRNRSRAERVDAPTYLERIRAHLAEQPQYTPSAYIPVQDLIYQLADRAQAGDYPIEREKTFEFASIDDINALHGLGVTIEVQSLDEMLALLRNYGNVDRFRQEIESALSLLMAGRVPDAKNLLNQYMMFNQLDDYTQCAWSSPENRIDPMTIRYFVSYYSSADKCQKMVYNFQSYVNLSKEHYHSMNQEEIEAKEVFSPVLAHTLLVALDEIAYTIREYLSAYTANETFNLNSVLINNNVVNQRTYFNDIQRNQTLFADTYKSREILQFYSLVGCLRFAVFDENHFDEKVISHLFSQTFNVGNNISFIIVANRTLGTIELINNYRRSLTNVPAPEQLIFTRFSTQAYDNLQINQSYFIFDQNAQLLNTPIFTENTSLDLLSCIESYHLVDLLIADLLEIGFLQLLTLDLSIQEQRGLLEINGSFDFTEANENISYTIFNVADAGQKCFGRMFENKYVSTAEYFLCYLEHFGTFFIGINYFSPDFANGVSYTVLDYSNYNYGLYDNCSDASRLFVPNYSLQLYYNYTYRNNSFRLVFNPHYVINDSNIVYAPCDILTVISVVLCAVLCCYLLNHGNRPIQLRAARDELYNVEDLNKIHGTRTIEVPRETLPRITSLDQEDADNYFGGAQSHCMHRLLFDEDNAYVQTCNLAAERMTARYVDFFTTLRIHERPRPKSSAKQLYCSVERNIFVTVQLDEFPRERLELENVAQGGAFVIRLTTERNAQIDDLGACRYKLDNHRHFLDRGIDAPVPHEIRPRYDGYLEFTDLVILITE